MLFSMFPNDNNARGVQFVVCLIWSAIHTVSSTSSCQLCYCDTPELSSMCVSIGWNGKKCSEAIKGYMFQTETCFHSAHGVGLETIQPSGIMTHRADCCAPWVDVPFDFILGEFRVYNELEAVFQKNHTSNTWQLKEASPLPPTYDFPGLAAVMAGTLGVDVVQQKDMYGRPLRYDNTTCKHRCCVEGVVDKAKVNLLGSACIDDWSKCVTIGNSVVHPPCSETDDTVSHCSIWVPCSSAWGFQIDLYIAVPVLVVISVLAVGSRINLTSRYKLSLCHAYSLVILFGYACIPMYILTLLSACEYMHWAQTTEVNPNYISYQGCVAACNAMKYPPDVVLDRFCGDMSLSVSSSRQWAIWREDSNPLLGFRSTCPDNYCSQCGSKMGDLDDMFSLALFLQARTYISWVLVIFLTLLPINGMWMFGCLVCFAEWVAALVLVIRTLNLYGGRYQLNEYAGLGQGEWFPSMVEMACSCMCMDFVLFVLLGVMGSCCFTQLKYDEDDEPKVSDGKRAGSMFQVAIEPKYIRLRE